MRQRIRWPLALLAFLGGCWAAAVWLGGGGVISLGVLRLSSTDASRPLVVCAVAAIGYLWAAGLGNARRDASRLKALLTPARVALALTAATAIVAIANNSWTAGGPDSFAYVTQADLLLRGRLSVETPLAAEVPWPNAIATLTPPAYGAVADRTAVAPITGPGLPLMMAAAKAIAGHCALFLIVPLTGALLVWTTFAIGRQLGSAGIGLAAAWLVATSPTFLMMVKSPMSDVPAAALWAAAIGLALTRTRMGALAAGLATGMAILVRPNLFPLAAVIGAWLAWREWQVHRWSAARTLTLYAIGPAVACVAIALLNRELWGSPLASGYGDVAGLFSASFIRENVARYGRWLAETQTPLALAGLLALFIPWRRLWPSREWRSGAVLLGMFTAGLWGSYLLYIPFDAWWFLRFLLPCWPAFAIGTAALVTRIIGTGAPWRGVAAGVLLLVLGGFGSVTAIRLGVFPPGEGDRRYASIALLVEKATDPSSVILTSSHAGTVQYYGGRTTVRYDQLDEAWLDRALEWLQQQGRRPYILVEDWERPLFEQRFAALNRAGRLLQGPVLAFSSFGIPGTIYLFPPADTPVDTLQAPSLPDEGPRCIPPKAADVPRSALARMSSALVRTAACRFPGGVRRFLLNIVDFAT